MSDNDLPELTISLDSVCYIVLKAREFDAKNASTDENSGSNATDDSMVDVLEDNPDDSVAAELTNFIDDLSYDEQVDLVALMWLGRGEDTVEEWKRLHREAASAHNNRTAPYLLGEPMLGDHLEEGLAKLDLYCRDSSIMENM